MAAPTTSKDFFYRIRLSAPEEAHVLLAPSAFRDNGFIKYVDYETASIYQKWLEGGFNLPAYHRHQKNGFPFFEEARLAQYNRTEYI